MSVELDVRQELAELAGHARQYADATAVLRLARRRRGRRYLASAGACAAMVLAVAVGANVLARRAPEHELGPAAPAPPPALPLVIEPPTGTAPALPTDRGIGRAGLVYQPVLGGPTYVVAEDGTQYQVPYAYAGDLYADPFRQMPMMLSPDGRWMAVMSDAGTHVRDLTSDKVLSLGQWDQPLAWSPDGHWLVYSHDADSVLLDLESGQSWPSIRDYGSARPTADIKVITVNFRFDGRVSLAWFDPQAGTETGTVFVDAGGALDPGEALAVTTTPSYGPDGELECTGPSAGWVSLLDARRLLLGVFDEPHSRSCTEPMARQVAYVVVDAATGRVTNRLDLPAGAGDPFWYGGDVAFPVRDAGGRVAVNIVGADGHDVGQLTSLPADAVFFFAGATMTATGPGVA